MYTAKRWAPLLGRILIALIFIVSGISKFMDLTATSNQIAQHPVPLPCAAAVLAALVELGGGLALLFGCHTGWAAGILVLFLIPVTYLFHNPIGLVGAAKVQQQIQLLKNLAIMGGLLLLVGFGPGPASVDRNVRPVR